MHTDERLDHAKTREALHVVARKNEHISTNFVTKPYHLKCKCEALY